MGRAFVLAVASAFLLGAPAVAEPPRTYAEMKERVAVQRFPDGRVMASSAPFAVVDEGLRFINGGVRTDSMSVLVEAWPDRPVVISLVVSWTAPLLPTETGGSDRNDPADPDRILEAHVGAPWRETTAVMVENGVKCDGAGRWCQWSRSYLVDLSQDQVREIVRAGKRRKISVGLGNRPYADWTIPRDHLIATLDAIGLLHAFK